MTAQRVIRRYQIMLIVFGIGFGLGGNHFLTSWWDTGSLKAAWSSWVAKDLPTLLVSIVFCLVILGIAFAWELHDAREKEARWEERPDGYQPDRLDD